ncbi:exodeoxyribonuclease I [Lysobacter xinjiangensis]|uniref:Exodeoxyribonuclease I n=1 Tax=Cognatilysobacter xinjiangensis TaxID=546892 RepID=A0ABQ3BXW1_9GAMM|nr:exodeoxyribonuclease I [Lysobacter xinjiangensis]GGZ58075.1 exodeoxyribonuclease I [Lysobacter xinjiangensis]
MSDSFLFYDLETFGACPRRSRIAQFAAIRTDASLQQVDDEISFFVKPADDLLPSPIASVITGITPQHASDHGVNEAEAFARIHDQMMRPGTCTAGYNSIRFDDEFVRYGFFRNFYDPYEREWRGGNCRWDLLDVMRLAHALRPDGVEWVYREDGTPSFTLEGLGHANGVRIGDAHEALSDVRALIGLAQRLRAAQPRLWDYCLRLRDKRFAGSLLDVAAMKPVLHVSQRFPASRLCAAPVMPLAMHPRVGNRVIVFDLAQDPDMLLALAPEAIADRLYVRQDELPDGTERIALKEVHLNRCPALVAWDHLREADLARLRIDAAQVARHAERIRARGAEIAEKVRRVYAATREREPSDCDASLYDGFLPDADRLRFPDVRGTPPQHLAGADFGFTDARLPELLFRYRARNWRDSLRDGERTRWDGYRRERLADVGRSEYTFDSFFDEIGQLRTDRADDARVRALLDDVEAWGRELQTSVA